MQGMLAIYQPYQGKQGYQWVYGEYTEIGFTRYHNGVLYKAVQDPNANIYSPDQVPAIWEVVSQTNENENKIFPFREVYCNQPFRCYFSQSRNDSKNIEPRANPHRSDKRAVVCRVLYPLLPSAALHRLQDGLSEHFV